MTLDQMALWLREGAAIERQEWKQSLIAMRLAQSDDADAIRSALRD